MAFSLEHHNKFFNKRDIIIRHLIIFLLTFFFAGLAYANAPKDTPYLFFIVYLSNFIYIAIIWNTNIYLMGLVDKWFDVKESIVKKLFAAVIIAFSLPILSHLTYSSLVFPLINGFKCSMNDKENLIFLIVAIVITLLVNSIYISIEFFSHWRKTLIEKEELKRNIIAAEFESLKNQINPHFLFNCLNTLSSLIEDNPKTATDFVQKLSSVYRYVLANKDKETVLLNEELDFIKSYIYLNKIRFGDNLRTEINVNADCLGFSIPTLTLQMLIENCIKHNVISQSKPLQICIGCLDGYVFVKNNLQPKILVGESSGIGLNNIISRYDYLSKKEVIIEKTETEFSVKVPLI